MAHQKFINVVKVNNNLDYLCSYYLYKADLIPGIIIDGNITLDLNIPIINEYDYIGCIEFFNPHNPTIIINNEIYSFNRAGGTEIPIHKIELELVHKDELSLDELIDEFNRGNFITCNVINDDQFGYLPDNHPVLFNQNCTLINKYEY